MRFPGHDHLRSGTQFLSNSGDRVPASVLTTPDGKPGLEAEYRLGLSLDSPAAPIITRVEPAVSLRAHPSCAGER